MKPEQSEFIKHDSGIISLIINTPKRWMEYQTLITFKRDVNDRPIQEQQLTIELYSSTRDFHLVDTLNVDFDFDHKKYHRLEEAEKDQIVVYFIPTEMLL